MKIIARFHGFPHDHNAGAEWAAHSLLRALVERGHEVSVYLSRYASASAPYDIDGVRVVPYAARMDFPGAAKGADALISHLENVPATAALARGYGIPLIILCHNTFEPTFRALAGSTALAVYNSQWMAEQAATFLRVAPLRPDAEVIVRPPVYAEDYRTKPGDRVTLVNLYGPKGADTFWALAERMPDVSFLGVRGAYGDQIIKDLPNVEVIDQVPGHQMREQVYARSRIVLMPSSYESWGRVGIEAYASGLPVIAHPTPGLTESLGKAGIFVDREDIDGWEAALRRLLGTKTAWTAASRKAKTRSAQLDPAADLAAWCQAVEKLASR